MEGKERGREGDRERGKKEKGGKREGLEGTARKGRERGEKRLSLIHISEPTRPY